MHKVECEYSYSIPTVPDYTGSAPLAEGEKAAVAIIKYPSKGISE